MKKQNISIYSIYLYILYSIYHLAYIYLSILSTPFYLSYLYSVSLLPYSYPILTSTCRVDSASSKEKIKKIKFILKKMKKPFFILKLKKSKSIQIRLKPNPTENKTWFNTRIKKRPKKSKEKHNFGNNEKQNQLTKT